MRTQYPIQPREALRAVKIIGLDFVRETYHKSHLEYGLKHGLFDQAAVDAANRHSNFSHKEPPYEPIS